MDKARWEHAEFFDGPLSTGAHRDAASRSLPSTTPGLDGGFVLLCLAIVTSKVRGWPQTIIGPHATSRVCEHPVLLILCKVLMALLPPPAMETSL